MASIGSLFTKTITLLQDGFITVPSGENQISGSNFMPNGATSILVHNTSVTDNSKIILTPRALVSSPLVVTELRAGVGFVVSISNAPTTDVMFDWIIINTYSTGGENGQETLIGAGVSTSTPEETIPESTPTSTTTPETTIPESTSTTTTTESTPPTTETSPEGSANTTESAPGSAPSGFTTGTQTVEPEVVAPEQVNTTPEATELNADAPSVPAEAPAEPAGGDATSS
jgi:hypothetical protein